MREANITANGKIDAKGTGTVTLHSGDKLSVYPCGTEVKIKLPEITGIIIGVMIRSNRTIYDVSYFNAGEYKSIWLDDFEFTVGEVETDTIGFKT